MESQRQEFRIAGLSEPLSHYTDAVRFGDTVYVSGLAPLDREGKLVGENDPVAQTECILAHLKLILDTVGASYADVLKVVVYVTDIHCRQAINTVRRKYFGASRPASTLVEIRALAVPGMMVEIEAVVGLRR